MKMIIIILLCNSISLTCTYLGILHLNWILLIFLISLSIIFVYKYNEVCKEKSKLIQDHDKLLELMNEISSERLQFLLDKKQNIV